MIFLLISSVREIYSQFTVAQRHFSRTHASSGLVSTRTNIRLLASNLEFPLNAKEEVKYCDCLHMIIILRLKLHFLSLHFLRTERTAHTHTWIWLKFRLRGNATRLHKLHFSDMFCKSDFDQCGGEPAQWPVEHIPPSRRCINSLEFSHRNRLANRPSLNVNKDPSYQLKEMRSFDKLCVAWSLNFKWNNVINIHPFSSVLRHRRFEHTREWRRRSSFTEWINKTAHNSYFTRQNYIRCMTD